MTQDTPKRFFRIYGKAPSQASYKAMNLGEGVQTSQAEAQAEAQGAQGALQTAEPAWSWQIREVK